MTDHSTCVARYFESLVSTFIWKHENLHLSYSWGFWVARHTPQQEDAVSPSSDIMRAAQNQKSFWQIFDRIECFKLKTNEQIIALKYQIPSGRSPSL